jgi:hypothetical protein
MSRAVKGPQKRKMTVPGVLPCWRSMLKGWLCQFCAWGVDITHFLSRGGGCAADRMNLVLMATGEVRLELKRLFYSRAGFATGIDIQKIAALDLGREEF